MVEYIIKPILFSKQMTIVYNRDIKVYIYKDNIHIDTLSKDKQPINEKIYIRSDEKKYVNLFDPLNFDIPYEVLDSFEKAIARKLMYLKELESYYDLRMKQIKEKTFKKINKQSVYENEFTMYYDKNIEKLI